MRVNLCDVSTLHAGVLGRLCAICAVLAVTPDACLMLRMCEFVPLPTVLFWKGVAVATPLLLIGCAGAGADRPPAVLQRCPRMLLMGFVQACIVIGFATSVALTDPARALFLQALSPLWAALIGFCIGDGLRRRTAVSLVLCFGSVCLMALGKGDKQAIGARSWRMQTLGDLIAALTGCCMAAYLTMLRSLRTMAKGAQRGGLDASVCIGFAFFLLATCYLLLATSYLLLPPFSSKVAIGFALVAVAAAAWTHGLILPPSDIRFSLALAADATLVIAFYSLLTLAASHLAASELALYTPVEYVVRPPTPSMPFHLLPYASICFHLLPSASIAFHRLPSPSMSFGVRRLLSTSLLPYFLLLISPPPFPSKVRRRTALGLPSWAARGALLLDPRWWGTTARHGDHRCRRRVPATYERAAPRQRRRLAQVARRRVLRALSRRPRRRQAERGERHGSAPPGRSVFKIKSVAVLTVYGGHI